MTQATSRGQKCADIYERRAHQIRASQVNGEVTAEEPQACGASAVGGLLGVKPPDPDPAVALGRPKARAVQPGRHQAQSSW